MYTAIKIEKEYSTHLECIIKYYTILAVLNSLPITKAEINILSFTCVYREISSPISRQEFLKTFDMTKRSLENAIYRLIEKGFLIRKEKQIVLHKQLHIEFDTLIVQIQIGNGTEEA